MLQRVTGLFARFQRRRICPDCLERPRAIGRKICNPCAAVLLWSPGRKQGHPESLPQDA